MSSTGGMSRRHAKKKRTRRAELADRLVALLSNEYVWISSVVYFAHPSLLPAVLIWAVSDPR